MYERFTNRARNVMQLAYYEARRFEHESIGTEHILLGLVHEQPSVAANVLKDRDVSLETIRQEVEKIVQPGVGTSVKQRHTASAKKIIKLAIEESRRLNHGYVGTEHLLLGLLCEERGVAGVVLRALGLEIDTVRDQVVKFLA